MGEIQSQRPCEIPVFYVQLAWIYSNEQGHGRCTVPLDMDMKGLLKAAALQLLLVRDPMLLQMLQSQACCLSACASVLLNVEAMHSDSLTSCVPDLSACASSGLMATWTPAITA